jgi:DNA-methyltransferase (dcm)
MLEIYWTLKYFKMKHASLFSGIGGFDLAAEWMGWGNEFHCEWNEFGQKVLKHHFPNSISYHDITKTDFTKHRGQIDVLTGGFPCQPYSTAGLRKGKADERHLFPEMLRAIKEIQPRWVIGENVRGLVSWGGSWYSRRCMLTWKGKVMKSKRLLFQLQASTPRIKEKESGLLLTTTTREQVQDLDKFKARMEKYPNGTTMPNLATQMSNTLLQTPRASDKNKHWKTENWKGDDLGSQMNEIYGTRSHLSPLFVEEMMGFPENWTASPFQNGAMSQLKPMETQ